MLSQWVIGRESCLLAQLPCSLSLERCVPLWLADSLAN